MSRAGDSCGTRLLFMRNSLSTTVRGAPPAKADSRGVSRGGVSAPIQEIPIVDFDGDLYQRVARRLLPTLRLWGSNPRNHMRDIDTPGCISGGPSRARCVVRNDTVSAHGSRSEGRAGVVLPARIERAGRPADELLSSAPQLDDGLLVEVTIRPAQSRNMIASADCSEGVWHSASQPSSAKRLSFMLPFRSAERKDGAQ